MRAFLLLLAAAAALASPASGFVMLRSAAQCKAASVHPDGTIDGCISQFGDVHLSCGTSCRRSESTLSWNQQGPPGDDGLVADANLQCPPGEFMTGFSVASGVADITCEAATPPPSTAPTTSPTSAPTSAPTPAPTSAPTATPIADPCSSPLTAVAATWSSGASGTLDGVSVTLSIPGASPGNINLAGSSYCGAPLSSSTPYIGYGVGHSINLSFGSTVSDVLFYFVYFRGPAAGGPNPVVYTFDQPFDLVSGLAGLVDSSSTTLSLSAGLYYNGVIRFHNSFSSLSVTTTATEPNSAQGFTLATVTI